MTQIDDGELRTVPNVDALLARLSASDLSELKHSTMMTSPALPAGRAHVTLTLDVDRSGHSAFAGPHEILHYIAQTAQACDGAASNMYDRVTIDRVVLSEADLPQDTQEPLLAFVAPITGLARVYRTVRQVVEVPITLHATVLAVHETAARALAALNAMPLATWDTRTCLPEAVADVQESEWRSAHANGAHAELTFGGWKLDPTVSSEPLQPQIAECVKAARILQTLIVQDRHSMLTRAVEEPLESEHVTREIARTLGALDVADAKD